MAKLEAPGLDELIDAADRIVTAIVAERARNVAEPREAAPTFEATPLAAVLETNRSVLEQRDMAADPIVRALKAGLKEVGQMLFDRLGSTEKLNDAMNQIAERDPANEGRRLSPINSAWNGVGSDADRWWS